MTDFFQTVEHLARGVSETIDRLRLELHGPDFTFDEALPDYIRDDAALVNAVRDVAADYLERIQPEKVLGLPNDARRSKDPISRNTTAAVNSHILDVWRREHYARREGIDRVVAEAEGKVDSLLTLVSGELSDDIRRETGIERDIDLTSVHGLFRLSGIVRSQLYRAAGVREDPALLYRLCFDAVMHEREWDNLSNAALLRVLEQDGISVGEFETYLGRRITVPALATSERKGFNDLGYRVGEEADEMRLKRAVEAFVSDLRFPRTYNEAMTIERVEDRWAFILRRAYELSQEDREGLPIGFIAQHNEPQFQRELESYGLRLLCPYVRLDGDSLTRELCMIDGEAVMATCQGRYYSCDIYRDRTSKVALGEFTLPRVVEIRPTRVQIAPQLVEAIDLNDLREWWEGDGKYE